MTTTIRLVRSDGAELVLGDGPDGRTTHWRLPVPDVEGMARLDASVSTSPNVLRDGSSVVSKRVEQAERTVRARYLGDDSQGARARAISFFDPRHSFAMHVTSMGRTVWCAGELDAFDCPFCHANMAPELTFTLLCPDPYWRDEDRNERPFGDAEGRMGWPYVSHMARDPGRPFDHPAGFVPGLLVYDGLNTVYNHGDVPTCYRVEIRAKGPVEEPCISKDGRFVRLCTTLAKGDVAVIDFEASPPEVTVNGEQAIHLASRDSSFTGMRMQVGPNRFAFSCADEAHRGLAEVRVLFDRKYLGV